MCKDCVKGHCDRWDHLINRSTGLPLIGIEKFRRFPRIGYVAPVATVVATDATEPRCDCGGVFVPDGVGKMICSCCEASMNFPVATSAEAEAVLTLREHLLARRRTIVSTQKALADDDVKVTTHG